MDWKRLTASALMLGLLALPASAASITPQTTMKEARRFTYNQTFGNRKFYCLQKMIHFLGSHHIQNSFFQYIFIFRIFIVHKLVEILRKLSEGGNTVVVIEHNLDVIKTADYIIDMGPEGGDRGGTVIAKGTPEEIVKVPESYTGQYVKRYLENGDAGSDE